MKMLGLSLLTATLALGAGTTGHAAKPKAKGKAAGKAAPENPASLEEIGKLKGSFKWGLSPEEVITAIKDRIDEKYKERMEKTRMDPARQDRLRKEKVDDLNAVKRSYAKFEGQKSGLDVSIIDQEFAHNSAESMLSVKEDIWTRYFFFFEDRLYKMYMAFDKQALGEKDFKTVAGEMQAKYGKAREAHREDKSKAGSKKVLDHYVWTSSNADSLRFVDRSRFYDVYCLVVYDTNTADRVAERRKLTGPSADEGSSLVDAVTAKSDSSRDSNDNVIDRITGRDVRKPGDEKHADIVVPSVSSMSPADMNSPKEAAKAKEKGKDKKDSKKYDSPLDGLEL